MTELALPLPAASTTERCTLRIDGMDCGHCAQKIESALAALGLLSPVITAALHSVPDLAILANSARLLRSR